jgi:asparagine synthase (glutamine-hydrolysing)
MSAIAGAICWGNANASEVTRIAMARMGHRAPDGTKLTGNGEVALAHGALHTTPESIHENQPCVLGERWMVVVDGRIDNREELADVLGIDSAQRKILADADLFAQSWLRWRDEFWRHVVGDFALVAWDRSDKCLWLVRDRIGARPLFYARTGQFLVFASEAEALIGLPGVSADPDEDRLAYYLVPDFEDEDLGATWYRDVRRVQPGEQLRANVEGRVSLERYWTMQPLPLLQLRDSREYQEAFREVFNEAVRCRLRSRQPPSLMLSGGVDSASVLAAARILHREGRSGLVQPISVVSDDPDTCDETLNIERMLRALSGDAVRLPVPSFSGLVGVQEFADRIWNPTHIADNSIMLPMLVYMAATRTDSNVVLDGIDGDLVTLTPSNYAAEHLLTGNPAKAWREARMASRTHTYLQGVSPLRTLFKGMVSLLEPGWSKRLRCRVQSWRNDGLGPDALIDRDLAAMIHLRERRLANQLAFRRDSALRDHAAYLRKIWWNPGFTRALEGFDHAASRFGVEPRHPWCDQRVVEFFLQTPLEFKVRDGWTKHLVRAAYAQELGENVAWHFGKNHLGSVVTAQVFEHSALRVDALMRDSKALLAHRVDADALALMRTAWANRGTGHVPELDGVLYLATLCAWLDELSMAAS